MERSIIKIAFLIGSVSFSLSSCYYDKAALLKKIENSACDTTNVRFSLTLQPLFEQHCAAGCHTGISASAGIPLDTYEQVAEIANNGKLTGVITHTMGYSPMPKGKVKLSDCNISRIRVWISQGVQNN